jgi:hypothetical protein
MQATVSEGFGARQGRAHAARTITDQIVEINVIHGAIYLTTVLTNVCVHGGKVRVAAAGVWWGLGTEWQMISRSWTGLTQGRNGRHP